LELPDGNRSSDAALIEYAARDGRIVVTKDSDFVQNFLVTGEPRLLLISTGNIANDALETLIVANLNPVERAFEAHRYVELSRTALVVHD
jgi:predicted nuclease of predicted toxin-antitoxin system